MIIWQFQGLLGLFDSYDLSHTVSYLNLLYKLQTKIFNFTI